MSNIDDFFMDGEMSTSKMKKLTIAPSYPIRHEFPWSKQNTNCVAFCYPRNEKPFVMKGEFLMVDQYLKINNQPMIVHFRCYQKGKTPWLIYHVYGLSKEFHVAISGLSRIHPVTNVKGQHQRHWIIVSKYFKGPSVIREVISHVVLEKSVREVPRRWMSELNSFVNGVTSFPKVIHPIQPVSKPVVLTPEEIEKQKVEIEQQKALATKKQALKRSSKRMANVLQTMGAA